LFLSISDQKERTFLGESLFIIQKLGG
jgi:hypothetical protein